MKTNLNSSDYNFLEISYVEIFILICIFQNAKYDLFSKIFYKKS